MKRYKTVDLVTIALVAAILCILAPISIPLAFSPIPITLGWFAVVLAGIILGKRKGIICVLVYILLGAVGLPVFSGYTGGFQKILGPSGGYLWGYLFLVWMTGFFVELCSRNLRWMMAGASVGALLGGIICYGLGTLWMALQMDMTFMEALWAGVIPFIPLDLAKTVIAVIACCPIRQTLIGQGLLHTTGKRHNSEIKREQ